MVETNLNSNDTESDSVPSTDEEGQALSRLRKFLFTIFGVAVFFFVVVLIWYAAHFQQASPSRDPNDWGVFGDYVGGILNPLVSLSAFSALLYTIYLQTKALQISQRELHESTEVLKLTKDELTASKIAQQKQSESLHKQNVDNTFFNLLKLIREAREECTFQGANGTTIPAAQNINNFLTSCFHTVLNTDNPNNGVSVVDSSQGKEYSVINTYLFAERVHRQYSDQLKRARQKVYAGIPVYLRNIICGIDFVVSEIDANDRKRYFKILASQLAGTELVLLAVHGLGPDNKDFKEVLTNYDLLQNARQEFTASPALAILGQY